LKQVAPFYVVHSRRRADAPGRRADPAEILTSKKIASILVIKWRACALGGLRPLCDPRHPYCPTAVPEDGAHTRCQ
jgi:hypothetical protein